VLSAQEPSKTSKTDYGERVTKRVRFKKVIAEYEPSVKSQRSVFRTKSIVDDKVFQQDRKVSQQKSTVLNLQKRGMNKRFSTDTDPSFLSDYDVTIDRSDSVNTLDHPNYTFLTETSTVTDRNLPNSGYYLGGSGIAKQKTSGRSVTKPHGHEVYDPVIGENVYVLNGSRPLEEPDSRAITVEWHKMGIKK